MRVVPSLMLAAYLGGACFLHIGCSAEDEGTGTSLQLGSTGGASQVGGPGGATLGGSGALGGTAGTGTLGGTLVPGGGGTQGGAGVPCYTRTIDAYGAAPDMLIVLDRSLSMTLFGRWEPSKQAVKTIATDFGGLISFGLSTFPSDKDTCGGGQLDVPLKIDNSAAIGARLDQTRTNGLTPTGPALMQALNILGNRTPGLDAVTKPGFVLLVTDGEPTCQGIPGFADDLQQMAARSAVQALKAANIPTYVIGYQIDPAYQALMNELATLGGTQTYRPAESADQIVSTFREITKDVVKCTFDLAEAPADPKFVRVTIDKKSVALNAADGWVIQGKTVTLQGGSCATLKDGKGHLLNAQVECTEIVLN